MPKDLSRRQFLHGSSVAVATLLGPVLHSSAWAASASRAAGIQLYMVNDELTKDPAGTLKQIAAIGYKEVESAGFANLSVAEFRKRIEDAGLSCPSAHLRFGIEDTGRLLEGANSLGVKYAVSSVLPPRPPETADIQGFLKVMNNLSLDDFKKMAEIANQIGEQARKAGLRYAYHNHNIEFRDYGGQTGYSVPFTVAYRSCVALQTTRFAVEFRCRSVSADRGHSSNYVTRTLKGTEQVFGPLLVRLPITIEAHRGRFRTNANEIKPLLGVAKPLT